MKSWEDIWGQDNAVRYLTSSIRSGRLARSYLFYGPEGVGRALAARRLICDLFSDNSAKDGAVWKKIVERSHPDVLWVDAEESGSIKIGTVREIIDRLNLKPFQAPLSVAVVEDAHLLTRSASNALLKVLEEPPGNSLIILITEKKELLLPTVLSRTAEVRFGRLSEEQTVSIISPLLRDKPIEELKVLARLAQGSPGCALRFARENTIERLDEIKARFKEAEDEGNADLMGWDAPDRTALGGDIELMIVLLRESAVANPGQAGLARPGSDDTEGTKVFAGLSDDERYQRLQALIKAKKALEGNCNVKLLQQSLVGMICGNREVS